MTTIPRALPRVWGLLALGMVAGGAAGAPWLRAFGPRLALPALIGAAAASIVVPVLMRAPSERCGRLRTLAAVGADLLALVLFSLAVLTHGRPGPLLTGFRDGPVSLLSYTLPLLDPPALLAVPVALTWLAGAAAGHCLARGRPLGIAVTAWSGVFVLGYAATGRARPDGAAREDLLLALALLLPLLGILALQAHDSEPTQPDSPDARSDAAIGPPSPWRGAAAASAAIAAVLALTLGATAVPAVRDDAARAARAPRHDDATTLTPLALVSRLRTSPDAATTPVLDVEVDGPWSGYLPLADLDRYDGDGWTFRRDFQPSGGVVPQEPDPGLAGGRTLVQEIRVRQGLADTVWLPHLGRVRRVTGVGIDIDPADGMPVPTAPLTAGSRYRVVSASSGRRLADVGADAVASLSRPPVETHLPISIVELAPRLLVGPGFGLDGDSDRPLAQLRLLEQRLRRDYGLTPPASGTRAAGGTSFAEVLAGVLGPSRTGTPEQFATLFAAMARSLGVPARLVCGFRVLPSEGASTRPAGEVRVVAAQAWTWVELPVQGVGWVVADPSPSRLGAASAAPTVRARPRTSSTPSRSPDALVVPSEGGHAIAPPVPQASSAASGPGPLLPWWTALPVLALLALGAAFAVTARRRRRRQAARGARRQIALAWQEALADLGCCGLRDLDSMTATEVVKRVAAAYGRDAEAHARVLADLADVALFSTRAPLTTEDVARAWAARTALIAHARSTLSVKARLVSVVAAWVPMNPPARRRGSGRRRSSRPEEQRPGDQGCGIPGPRAGSGSTGRSDRRAAAPGRTGRT